MKYILGLASCFLLPASFGAEEPDFGSFDVFFQVLGDTATQVDLAMTPTSARQGQAKKRLLPISGLYVGLSTSREFRPKTVQSSEQWLERFAVPNDLPDVHLSLKSASKPRRTVLIHPGQGLIDVSWSWRKQGIRKFTHNLIFAGAQRLSHAHEEYVFGNPEVTAYPISLHDPANLLATSQIILSGNLGGGLTDHAGRAAVENLPTKTPIEMYVILPGLDRSQYEIASSTLTFDERWRFTVQRSSDGKQKHVIKIRKKIDL